MADREDLTKTLARTPRTSPGLRRKHRYTGNDGPFLAIATDARKAPIRPIREAHDAMLSPRLE